MKVLVIGSGGREHAIIKKLKENPTVEVIYCLPGNGGIAADAVCVPEIGAKDIPAQVEFAKAHRIDYAVVAPDDPLALGAVDALSAAGIPCFGPDKKAAGIDTASGVPNKNKVGSITLAQAEEIAKTKMPDLNAASLEAACSMVRGTCRSMGVTVEG